MASDIRTALERLRTTVEARQQDPEYQERIARQLSADEAEQRRLDRERARRIAGVPARAWRYLDALSETDAVKAVREFLDSPLTLLILAGGEGCGKTIGACAALEVRSGQMLKAAALVRARFDRDEWDRAMNARLLVIDDLGATIEDEKGWALAAFYEIIDWRYDSLAKTIVTCNLTADRFRARYCVEDGGRLAGRIRESGRFVELDGASLRKAAP